VTASRRVDPALIREAFTLPLLFLTVALAGSLRVSWTGAVTFAAPPLMALVLAVLLLGTLFRGGLLVPDALVRPARTALENTSGALVLITLFAAAAQVLGTLTPEAGLLALTFNLVFLVLLGNTMVARPDRGRLLASLLVVLGAALVAKYVLLGALYAPGTGLTKRIAMALLEGLSLGALSYDPPGPATGYLAFFAALLFLIGLVILPGRAPGALTALPPSGESTPRALGDRGEG
jgi:hypothetical protein